MVTIPAVLDGNGATIIPAQEVARPDATGPDVSVDNAVPRFDGTTGKTLQSSPLIIADTTGALSRAGGGGIFVQGRNTNTAPAAGDIGEEIKAEVLQASALAFTTTTARDILSLALTAGHWKVDASLIFQLAASASITDLIASLSTTTATLDLTASRFVRHQCAAFAPGAGSLTYPLPTVELLLAAPTTLYLVGRATFTAAAVTGWGKAVATRVS